MFDSNAQPKIWAIVPAAGFGTRMNLSLPKQYCVLHGKTILEHTLQCLLNHSKIEKIIVVIAANDQQWSQLAIAKHSQIMLAEGGKERFHSVWNGLQLLDALAKPNDWILVHDVARPCLQQSDIDKLLSAIKDDAVGGLLATRVRDTLKRSDDK